MNNNPKVEYPPWRLNKCPICNEKKYVTRTHYLSPQIYVCNLCEKMLLSK